MENNKTLQDANDNEQEGESDMSVCWLFCKCKPNYIDAVTSFERAADLYHQCNRFQEEIRCRERAVVCNRALGECWKEGMNHEKVANIYLVNFSKFDDAVRSIENAHVAYRSKGEYKDSMNCLLKISKIFRDMNQMDHALKCMKVAFDFCIQTSGMNSGREEDSIFTFYNVFDFYSVLLFITENYKEALNAASNFTKSIISEKYQSKLMKCHGIIVISNLILEDFEANNSVFEGNYNDDSGIISDLQTLHGAFVYGEKSGFNDALRNISMNYDNIIIKRLNDNFMEFSKKKRDLEVYVIKEEDSFRDKMR